jgi:hypothetical protein
MDSSELVSLVAFGANHSFDSVLVVRHGRIVAEAYYAPYRAIIPHEIHSCTKAVISTLAAAGVVGSLPATLVAAFASGGSAPTQLGSIDLAVWASVSPAQALAAWFGARLAQRVAADNLSRIMAVA